MGLGTGTFMLGVPKGFNRFGPAPARALDIFASYDEMIETFPNLTTKFSVPVWKYLDERGNTFVRWFSPRTNYGWTVLILGDAMDRLHGAITITQDDIEYMD